MCAKVIRAGPEIFDHKIFKKFPLYIIWKVGTTSWQPCFKPPSHSDEDHEDHTTSCKIRCKIRGQIGYVHITTLLLRRCQVFAASNTFIQESYYVPKTCASGPISSSTFSLRQRRSHRTLITISLYPIQWHVLLYLIQSRKFNVSTSPIMPPKLTV